MITLIIADDHSMLREGFRALLRHEKDIKVVGEAANGQELLELASSLRPDVIITDIDMPVLNGLNAALKLREAGNQASLIALSMHIANSLVIDMLKAGARGYLTKNTDRNELVMAIKSVHEGGTYFSDAIPVSLTRLIDKHELNPYRNVKPVDLSPKEISIMQYICQEYSSKQIAPLVELTKRTVDSYRLKILEKIDSKTVVGMVLYAIKHRLFTIEE